MMTRTRKDDTTMTKVTHYALMQVDGAIHGVGQSPEDAREDAAEWMDLSYEELDDAPVGGRMDHGALVIVPCTEALACLVVEDGGLVNCGTLPDGALCTLEEEAAASA